MRKKSKILISFMFIASFLLGGCGQQIYEPVDLIEPVGSTEFYRPVDRGDVGDITTEFGDSKNKQVAIGSVVYKEEPYYWTTRVKIKDIKVRVGDMVNKGDLLAYVDTKNINEEIQVLQDSLNYENESFILDSELYDIDHDITQTNMQWSQELEFKDEAKAYKENLGIMEENREFDIKLHELKVNHILDDISKKNELKTDSNLTARSSGMVTYIKDTKLSPYVNNDENVVVIADLDNRYIELSNCTIAPKDRHYLDKYENFYTYIDGKKYNLVEYKYSPEEVAIAENKNEFPCMRFVFEDEQIMPEIGDNVLIYMSRKTVENVLRIGTDSLLSDENGEYVYVFNNGKKEERHIKTGQKNSYYCEVLEGLEEGELVYYTTNTYVVGEYDVHDVVKSTYVDTQKATSYKNLDSENIVTYSDYEGVIKSVNISEGTPVTKDQVVLTIQINEGSADIARKALELSDAKLVYDATIKDLDKQKTALKDLKYDYDKYITDNKLEKKKMEEITLEDRMNIYQNVITEKQINQIDAQKKKLKLDYEYHVQVASSEYEKMNENNNGYGVISVLAPCDGTMEIDSKIGEGKQVVNGDKLFTVKKSVDERITINTNSVMHYNQEITLTGQTSSEKYTGRIVGGPGMCHNVFISMKKNRMYFTHNTADSNKVQYYVEMDDPDFYKAIEKFDPSYSNYKINDAIIVPAKAIHKEMIMNNEYIFVWKIVDDQLIKQYVTLMTENFLLNNSYGVISGLNEGDQVALERGM